MNILLVNHAPFFGGAEAFLVDLLSALDRKDFSPTIVTDPRSPVLEQFRSQHFTCERGVVWLEKKYRGKPTPFWRATLRLIRRSARLPLRMLQDEGLRFECFEWQAEIYDALGQLAR